VGGAIGGSADAERTGPRIRVLALAGSAFMRFLAATVRFRFHGRERVREWESTGRPFIVAFWHRHLLLMRWAFPEKGFHVLISRSRDGELIARVVRRLGIATVRGSSSRGGAAGLRGLLRAARAGACLGITPDGPRGPSRVAQPGVALVAAASGLPVFPVAICARRARELGSWDRMPVPWPGTRVEVVYGGPIEVPRRGDPVEWAGRIGEALNEVEREACRRARDEER